MRLMKISWHWNCFRKNGGGAGLFVLLDHLPSLWGLCKKEKAFEFLRNPFEKWKLCELCGKIFTLASIKEQLQSNTDKLMLLSTTSCSFFTIAFEYCTHKHTCTVLEFYKQFHNWVSERHSDFFRSIFELDMCQSVLKREDSTGMQNATTNKLPNIARIIAPDSRRPQGLRPFDFPQLELF